jgi:hypothetical protein
MNTPTAITLLILSTATLVVSTAGDKNSAFRLKMWIFTLSQNTNS